MQGSIDVRYNRFRDAQFLAWDGEGITEGGEHRYVLLTHSGDVEPVIDVDGIRTIRCLEMMASEGEKHPKHIHVAFGASYDVNMILGECTIAQVEKIWSGAWVKVGKFSIQYRPRKTFSIRRHGAKKSSLILWDVFGFFQSSFVDAAEKYLGGSKDLDVIRERKKERSVFSRDQLSDIVSYCQLECTMLVALMDQLRQFLVQADLPISRWDGAGACAAALLRRQGITLHKSVSPEDVQLAARHAYAGGRTELVRYGHAPSQEVHHYDINSAYPYAMQCCPSLANGKWEHQRGMYRGDCPFQLVHIKWQFHAGAPLYPFPWRAHDSSIYYPHTGEGWYWLPEYEAALHAFRTGRIDGHLQVLESYAWHGDDVLPFQWIAPLFELRAQWKRDGNGAEKALKLAINSLYGKTAQHVGGQDGKPPRYHQIEWAGFITSMTRAKLYRAACESERVVMLATDAVYSLDPIPSLVTDNQLGNWSYEKHCGITVAQSGVYWTDAVDGLGVDSHMFCRGFDKGSLVRREIVHAWRAGKAEYKASLTRFAGMGSALASPRRFKLVWRHWLTAPRTLALRPDGTKRFTKGANNPARGLVLTGASYPAAMAVGQTMSAPYPLPWEINTGDHDVLIDGVSARIIEAEAMDAIL